MTFARKATTLLAVWLGLFASHSSGLLLGPSPDVYLSLLVAPHVAVEPQIGFVWFKSGGTFGSSSHVLSIAGQIDYFVKPDTGTPPYIPGPVGPVDVSGSSPATTTTTGGVGYRMQVGDRLVFRADSQLEHAANRNPIGNEANALVFAVSIGGVLGQR